MEYFYLVKTYNEIKPLKTYSELNYKQNYSDKIKAYIS